MKVGKQKSLLGRLPSIYVLRLGLRLGLSLGLSLGFNLGLLQASPLVKVSTFPYSDLYGLSPFWKWKNIESENFNVTFPEELSSVANLAANYLEEAHSILSPLLHWKPDGKTQVILIDNQDSANGLTTPLANFGLILWATPPDSNSSTNFYDNWLRLLCIHEYTHYLNMDTTYGFWKFVRPIFGSLLLPNAAWPPWMLEGLAVYMETQFTTSGRGRSTYWDMVLRAATYENVLGTPDFITLDKVNGTNPYFPGGDTRYIFGYSLMNEIASTSTGGQTADGKSTLAKGGVETLGEMSFRSGSRVPLFINGNLENITGKTWYDYWDQWVEKTKIRTHQALSKINSQPLTHFKLLTQPHHTTSNDAEGMALSSDGRYLAYNLTTAHLRPGLFLLDLKTNNTRYLGDKLGGIGMNFIPTPDIDKDTDILPTLIYSELNQDRLYYLYSDLKAYNLNKNSNYFLTRHLRARDPDVSSDGAWIVFTIAENAMTLLARARLNFDGQEYSLGTIEKIYTPAPLDRVANPKFSPDGQRVYFSLHPNGKFQEDIMALELSDVNHLNAALTLVSDGSFNRFPAVDQKGDLYYISNRTGVDNLYRFDPHGLSPKLLTNWVTGFQMPVFDVSRPTSDQVYASVLSSSGWDIALIDLPNQDIQENSVTVAPPPVVAPLNPSTELQSEAQTDLQKNTREIKKYEISDYYFAKTMLPRMWTPTLEYSNVTGLGFGIEGVGFDATNQHQYILGASYSPTLQLPDFYALYANRTLGPTLTFLADILTTSTSSLSSSGNFNASYSREADASISAFYPILWTYSSITPLIAYNVQKIFNYQFNLSNPTSTFQNASLSVSSLDLVLSFSNREISNLSVTYESGRFFEIGSRLYLLPDGDVIKFALIEQEFIKLFDHTVLTPSVKATTVSNLSQSFSGADATLVGRLNQVLNPFVADGLNYLSIRGYPGYQYLAQTAVVTALDLTFPLGRIFRGWGTNPLFLDNLYGFVFGETSYINSPFINQFLPSFGGGINLSLELATIPCALTLEYNQGVNTAYFGGQDFFLQFSLGLPNI